MPKPTKTCESCGDQMKVPIGYRCQRCLAAERSARETFSTDGPSQKARYHERHGCHGTSMLLKRIRERNEMLARLLGERVIREAEECVLDDEE